MTLDINALVAQLLKPEAMVIWLPLLTGLLGLHAKQPAYMQKKDGE